MEIRKNFGKYWLAGLIFAVIAGALQWITSYLGTAVTASFQPGFMWGLILGVMGILLFIFVPWIYGRLIEWIYLEFIPKINNVLEIISNIYSCSIFALATYL